MPPSSHPYEIVNRDGDQYIRVSINGESYDVEYREYGRGRVTVPKATREKMDEETLDRLTDILSSNNFTYRYGNPDSAS